MGLSVGIAVGENAGGSGVSVSVNVDIGERGVSLAGTGVLVGVKVDVGGIGVAVGVAEGGSGVAVGRTDTGVNSAVPQAASSNAQSKRPNRCRLMATPFSQRLLPAVRAVHARLIGAQAGAELLSSSRSTQSAPQFKQLAEYRGRSRDSGLVDWGWRAG